MKLTLKKSIMAALLLVNVGAQAFLTADDLVAANPIMLACADSKKALESVGEASEVLYSCVLSQGDYNLTKEQIINLRQESSDIGATVLEYLVRNFDSLSDEEVAKLQETISVMDYHYAKWSALHTTYIGEFRK